ncbi:MAG: hypothetical protein ACRDVN_00080 [Jiangellaceae bacterium]
MRAFLMAVLGVAFVSIPAPAAGAQESRDDGLRFETATSFRLNPEDKAIHVTVDITVTNEVPNQGNYYTYFEQIGLPAQAEATNITAHRDGGSMLSASLEETDDPRWSVLGIRLSPNLLYGRSQRIRLTYDLPDLPPRSEGWTRANDAYATFSAFGFGDPGLADVEIVIPVAYDVEVAGDEMVREAEDGAVVLRASDIPDPDTWWVNVVARDDDLLDEHVFSVGDRRMVLRAWPGDDRWATFVRDQVGAGVPALEELIGLPWPVADELEIFETSTPDLYGYGGWYDHGTDVIEISDRLDPQVVLHELSHAWFNPTLFTDRWMSEGLAEEFAARSLAGTGGEPAGPPPVTPGDPGAQPLLDWAHVELRDGNTEEQESYGYAASWWIVHQLTEEIGPAAMAEVIGAVADREISYLGDPEPETWRMLTDWRRTLDLLEEVGGSAEAGELFAQLVVTPEEKPLLEERAAAREVYEELVAEGDGWTAPLELRDAMARWSFDDAGALAGTAQEALADRDAALVVLADLGVEDLPALEGSYEGSEDLDALVTEASRYAQVAAKVGQAHRSVSNGVGLLESVGLLGTDVERELTQTAERLAGGDVEAAGQAADDLLADLDDAALRGGGRYALLAVGLLGVGLMWRVRERRVGSAGWVIAGPSSSRSSSPVR